MSATASNAVATDKTSSPPQPLSPLSSSSLSSLMLNDPLAINLHRQSSLLLTRLPEQGVHYQQLYDAFRDVFHHHPNQNREGVEIEEDGATPTREIETYTPLLETLSRLLAVPELTILVAGLFRPLLMDLCARWIDDEDMQKLEAREGEKGGAIKDEKEEAERLEGCLKALALLIEVHEELFSVLDVFLGHMLFNPDGPLGFITDPEVAATVPVGRLHCLLLMYYRILQANRELPGQRRWSFVPLLSITQVKSAGGGADRGAKLLAIKCYALQCGMGEAERERWEGEVVGSAADDCECWANCGRELGVEEEKRVDCWVLPLVEMQRVKKLRQSVMDGPDTWGRDFYSQGDGLVFRHIRESELSPHIVNIYGVFLLRSLPKPGQVLTTQLVPTPTSTVALQRIALHISLRLPVMLTSPPSSGKSLLIKRLAQLLFPSQATSQAITIHLADTSLDARSLLGSYISSPTQPGTFEWKEGVVIRAMRHGKWLVLKDIDRASSDVLGVLKPLVESLKLGKWIGGRAYLEVLGRGCVVAEEGFALFATRSVAITGRDGGVPPATFLGAHKFYEIVVGAPGREELKTILETRYPRLKGDVVEGVVTMWQAIKDLGTVSAAREVGLRELEKFCERVERLAVLYGIRSNTTGGDGDGDVEMEDTDTAGKSVLLSKVFTNPALREDLYVEARDVFFGAGTTTTAARLHYDSIASVVGDHLGLDAERRQWVLHGRVPEFNIEKDVNGFTTGVSIGRTRLFANREVVPHLDDAPPPRPFAMHKPGTILLSRIATAVSGGEPILLTGETGTGKTSIVTHLAGLLRRRLISLNLSQQTESSDLIGGFKPVDARVPGGMLQSRFLDLFGGTFSRRKNEKFESEARKAVGEGKWKRAVGLWKESARLAKERILAKMAEEAKREKDELDVDAPRKRRKVDGSLNVSSEAWASFLTDVEEFEVQHVHSKGKFAFGFVEGPLVQALRCGDWVLLDEVNLASSETLESITSILSGPTASITLTEQGSLEPVPRHPEFRLFACMNPATDVGKKDLPPNIRSRFTEVDVPSPDNDKETLLSIITQYIGSVAVGDKGAIMNVAEFYMAVKELAEKRQIADGANHRPHYSMRTLARAMTFAADIASSYSLRRAIWEGCLMAFTMVLDSTSAEAVTALAHRHLLAGVRNPKSLLTREPAVPRGRSADEFVKLGPFYLEKGPHPVDSVEDYITTPSVETKLIDLARIILTRRFPILIEGPTSSGKTSSIEYLAKRTGHRFVRINNHEHTDIQEYIGSYVSDPTTGKLVFKDGLLVRALRNGDWIVLDELNLAPTDVLEALNRLLDDNRELVIPETHEVVKPHPHFMLFATQNPPGLYAGRKVLSRAFRNRFLEVHFEDVPQAELETILCQRCRIAPSYGKKIVSVFHELQTRRQAGRVFESKHGFATLRDLFRWAGREAVGYQELAENGYMLLAERTRREDDKNAVKEVIESVMGIKINERTLYDLVNMSTKAGSFLGCSPPSESGIVWTNAMQRLFILVSRALKFNEPVLLVGETGSGKTSVCQVFANTTGQTLYSLNCHQNTETADLIGGLRPVRNRSAAEAEAVRQAQMVLQSYGETNLPITPADLLAAINTLIKSSAHLTPTQKDELQSAQRQLLRLQSIFEWSDGPLVNAMRSGDVFLLDEISLADDSVLERLNSVLEPGRTMVLAERGGDDQDSATIRADDGFKLVATMNPGGDYGKKELSPALRNRFTEIWVPSVDNRHDLEMIVSSLWKWDVLRSYTKPLLDWVEWMCTRVGDKSLMSLRDILAWVTFSNEAHKVQSSMPLNEIFHHAAHMTYLDGLGSLPQLSAYSKDALLQLKTEAAAKLQEAAPNSDDVFVPAYDPTSSIQLGSFAIQKGAKTPSFHSFNLQAPTTRDNAMRVVRACQVPKPILLEGSPGVGKTSLVTALANIAGHELCRINLSDQSDIVDLFGSDLPVEGGGPGEFAWKDAEFLKALQEGHWVLLDEMNLAPQAVLEGLNAVLDHRGTVFIPELGRTFVRHPSFRIFAAQNPLSQGGGRKGLPKSFVNRFTKVYVEELTASDLMLVCQHTFPDLDETILKAMISFNTRLHEEVAVKRTFGREGNPWEFNLRDVIRWGALLRAQGLGHHPIDHLRSVYLNRFRTTKDRDQARALFEAAFGTTTEVLKDAPRWSITTSHVQFGYFFSSRRNLTTTRRPTRVLKMQLSAIESLGLCVSQSWLAILTGSKNSGKSSIVRTLANVTGNNLYELPVSSATDTMDILGSFEQVDAFGRVLVVAQEVLSLTDLKIRAASLSQPSLVRIQDLRDALRMPWSLSLDALISLTLEVLADAGQTDDQSAARKEFLFAQLDYLRHHQESIGRFEWVDGPLVRAMKLGHWLLLDGANLCSPSVLDRLNSLCEPNGVLTLSERGFVDGHVQIIKPHPSFRLFMSVDPQYGELSRAMRNRGIEIGLFSFPVADDPEILKDSIRLPNDNPSQIDCPMFEGARRGLVMTALPLLLPSAIPTSGHTLDQESSLSTVVDHSPRLFLDVPTPFNTGQLLFACQTLHPAHLGHLLRFLGISGLIDKLVLIKSLWQTINHGPTAETWRVLRDEHTQTWGVHPAFVLAQPHDFFLNRPPDQSSSLDPTKYSDHHLMYSILHLIVYLLDQRQDPHFEPPVDDNLYKQARTELRSVYETVHEAAESTLGSLLSRTKPDNLENLHFAGRMASQLTRLKCLLNQDIFDFSSVRALTEWLWRELKHSPPSFIKLVSQVDRLKSATSLSAGVRLTDVWSAFYRQKTPELHVAEINRLEDLVSGAESESLRRSAFDLIALLEAQTDLKVEEKAMLQNLDIERPRRVSADRSFVDPLLIVAELGLMISIPDHQKYSTLCRRFIDIVCQDSRTSLSRVVSYQHTLWAIKEGRAIVPSLARNHLLWHDGLWKALASSPADASILVNSTLASAVVSLCESTGNLASFQQFEAESLRVTRLLLLQGNNAPSGSEPSLSRTYQLWSLFQESLLMIFQCLKMGGDIVKQDDDSASGPTSVAGVINQLISVAEGAGHSDALHALRTFVLPAIAQTTKLQNHSRGISNLGSAWIALSRMALHLLVPNAPLDPAAVVNAHIERLTDDHGHLNSQALLHHQLELGCTGNETNEMQDFLGMALRQTVEERSSLPVLPQRPNVTLLHTYWAEIAQFQIQVISPAKLDSLLVALQRGDDNALLRERVVQQSMAGFLQRLDSVYPDYADISLPLQISIFQMRLGLHLVARSSSFRQEDAQITMQDVGNYLVAFPTVKALSFVLKSVSGDLPGLEAFTRLEFILKAIAAEISLGVPLESRIRHIDTTYDRLIRLWLIDRAKDKEAEQSNQTLYRQNQSTHNPLTDAEIEQQEFISLFPSFEDVFDEATSGSATGVSHVKHLIPQTALSVIADIHSTITTTKALGTEDFNAMRRSALTRLLKSSPSAFPDSLDVSSHSLLLSMLSRNKGLLHDSPTPGPFYNFYLDSNIPEARKATHLVTAMKSRLEALMSEWPDQMVLVNLHSRCDQVLALDLSSPVAKILAALEQLLVLTDDWEMYANRQNTLKLHQQAMTNQIVAWRRMELSCWQGLLDSQLKSFGEGTAEWWYRLYDALVRGPLDVVGRHSEEDTLTPYLTTLIPLLDDFIRTSPLGQFFGRMELLLSFETYIGALAVVQDLPSSMALNRVRTIVHSTHQHYNVFTPRLTSLLQGHRSSLEKDIRGFIKLASWRDVNVHALKQSAQRTHHQLYKIIRKFRDVLRLSIIDHLQPQFAADSDSRQLAEQSPEAVSHRFPETIDFPSNSSTDAKSNHDLARKYQKFCSVATLEIRSFINSRSSHNVDDLAIEIITTAKHLANSSVLNADATKERREKAQKALLVRKRKAWSNLLKELKRVGFAAHPKPEVLQNHHDALWVREQPIVPFPKDTQLPRDQGETYYVKLQSALPELRSCIPNHHSDLTTRELQRGVAFLESGFSMSLDLRSRLSKSTMVLATVVRTSFRFKQLLAASIITQAGPHVIKRLEETRELSIHLQDALKEIVSGIHVYHDLQSETRIPLGFIEEVEQICQNTCDKQMGLSELLKKVKLTKLSILTCDEAQEVDHVSDHLSSMPNRFQEWLILYPVLSHLIHPTLEWFSAQTIPAFAPQPPLTVQSQPDVALESLMTTFLLTFQNILSRCSVGKDEADDDDNYIRDEYQSIREFSFLLNLDSVQSRLDDVLAALASHPDPNVAQSTLQKIVPFLDVYLDVAEAQLTVHTQWNRSLFKLNFVLCSIMHTLAKQGYCKPPDLDEAEAGGESTETVDGLGMGEGSGVENVSKEIEDESQVEGLKGEGDDEEEGPDRDDDDNDAIEMSEDVGGKMEDVPDDKSEEGDDQSDDESDMAPEEKMGDLDASDPSAIDEKLWGDEKGPEDDKNGDDKTGKELSDEQTGESEVVAKEKEKEANKKEKKREEEEKAKDENSENKEDEPPVEETLDDTGDESKDDPAVSGAPMDEHIPDTDALDLPDDINLGPEDDLPGAESEGEDMGDDMELDETVDEGPDREEIDEPDKMSVDEGDDAKGPTKDDEGGQEEEPTEEEKLEAAGEGDQEEEQKEEDDSQGKDDAVARPDVSAGNDWEDSTQFEDANAGEGAATNETRKSAAGGGKTSNVEENQKEKQSENEDDTSPQTLDETAAGSNAGISQGQSHALADQQADDNPRRSVGDAIKEIQRRFDEIMHAQQTDQQPRKVGEENVASQLEYLQPEDEDSDMQALGPSNEEKAANLNELTVVEDETLPGAESMDIEPPAGQSALEREAGVPLQQAETSANEFQHDLEGAVLREPHSRDNESVMQISTLPDIEMEEQIDKDAELQLREWQVAGYPEEQSERIWRSYESMTHDLAYALCEQLRLILEPTLATRLKGDYRTGKRLNMKKIISYIASDYTKDKIWLRRTRPSQREYQVLIALDDSRSMAESHSVHLAYQTLALVSKALSRLESGDIAIARFGESMDILHGFDEGPFTDHAGRRVISAFRFNQKATNVLHLVEASLKALERARERRATSSSSAADLWQLEIIISDGLCQDHEQLRTVLRKAEEQRVMIVFIFIDTLHSGGGSNGHEGSILSMNKAEYVNVNGRMELQLRKYLDSFPFEYYVILRDVEALPEVLAGTLKQFFERISEE